MDELRELSERYSPAKGHYVCGLIFCEEGNFYVETTVRFRGKTYFSDPLPVPRRLPHSTKENAIKSLEGIRTFVESLGFVFEIEDRSTRL